MARAIQTRDPSFYDPTELKFQVLYIRPIRNDFVEGIMIYFLIGLQMETYNLNFSPFLLEDILNCLSVATMDFLGKWCFDASELLALS